MSRPPEEARSLTPDQGSPPADNHKRLLNSREVARLAGVSQATVSRVLSSHPHVAEETRRRVLKVIEAHDYVPNLLARSLVTRRSNAIGLVVSNITNLFYPELIEAVCTVAASRDLSVILCNTQQDPDRQRDHLRLLIEQRVAGIVMTSVMVTAPYVAELVAKRYPIVLVNRHLPGVTSDAVVIDNRGGAVKAVQHLLGLGHRRIAYVRGLAGTTTNRDRERGYRDAARAASLPLDPTIVFDGDYTWDGARQAAARFVRLADRPTAALCADDGTALGFIDGLADAGLRTPEDCAVIGFDDIRTASHRAVGLTTVRQPVARMAELAMDVLLRRIGGDLSGPRRIVLPADLIVRRSCGGDPAWCTRAAAVESGELVPTVA